jgi:hypothetical protein
MWVTCAQRPLREEEIQQVLAIDVGESDFTRGPKEWRIICEDCGPIIEVVDGIVQFVHFSAKEYSPLSTKLSIYSTRRLKLESRYLLDKQSNYFIRLPEAHLNIWLICASYLAFSSLDTLFSEEPDSEIVEMQIVNGDFVLLEYATLYVVDHIVSWIRCQTSDLESPEVAATASTILNRLFATRRNNSSGESRLPNSSMSQFKIFQNHPHIQRTLANAAHYMTGCKEGLIEVEGRVKHRMFRLLWADLTDGCSRYHQAQLQRSSHPPFWPCRLPAIPREHVLRLGDSLFTRFTMPMLVTQHAVRSPSISLQENRLPRFRQRLPIPKRP